MKSNSNPEKSLFEISTHEKQAKSWKNHEVEKEEAKNRRS